MAQRLLTALESHPDWSTAYATVELAGPGFLNVKLSPTALAAWLHTYRSEESLRVGAGSALAGRTVVIDYSSPNTAKEMHVGHIRSTVIGEACARLLAFAGATVIRDNHLGDWGTQFGMIIWSIKHEGYDLFAPHDHPIADLEALYKRGNAHYKSSPEAADAIRAELVKLQAGDPENLALWKEITRVSWVAFETIYNQLGVRFDEALGESFYRDHVDAVYAELTETGIAEESDGALVVFHRDHKRFATQPFIIRKADGASNYGSTDLATIRYRSEHFKADEMIYVVDARQGDHFEQLFLTARRWYQARNWPLPALKHVSFGTILGEDGRPIKTKEGGSVKLKDLLAEAIERSFTIVSEKNPDMPEPERRAIARAVGLGAVRYVDLSQNRTSDYIFSWDKMLAFEGNTAPYLLYAVARIHSIFRKLNLKPGDSGSEQGASLPETETELALARRLVAFTSALDQSLSDLRPHFLSAYLYDLAGAFSTFYNAEKVLVDDPAVRARRLLLCARTLTHLETGLHLLGLETLERM